MNDKGFAQFGLIFVSVAALAVIGVVLKPTISLYSDQSDNRVQAANSQAIAQANITEQSSTKKVLPVPFLVQAPFGRWDYWHEEACEEVSLLMAKHYRANEPISDIGKADQELVGLVKFVEQKGYKRDVTVAELKQIAQAFYGMDTGRVETNVSIEKIKQEIDNGKPVILPLAGKKLRNPNFRQGGPRYHMLVVKGYDAQGFITNEPGTRKGNGYRYGFQHLYDAIHDFNAKDMLKGQKAYLVFD